MLTQARVRELFDYNPETGDLIRKVRVSGGRAEVGTVAGWMMREGYKAVKVDGKAYKVHRLVWFYHHGYFPEHQIDHINRNPSDNRIENLREVSPSCNMRNQKARDVNSSGVTGVYWHKCTGRWSASISISKHLQHLGIFDTILDAAKARHQAEVDNDWPNCCTTSSAYQYIKSKENHTCEENSQADIS